MKTEIAQKKSIKLTLILGIFIIGLIYLNIHQANQFTKTMMKQSEQFTEIMVAQEPDVLESDLPHKKLGKFTLSWYSPKELGKTHPHELKTSTGKTPVSGKTIAVDPKVIPYGSIIYIQDYGYFIAEDCGGAIKGNRIDIFTANHSEAIQNGKRVANVYLLR